MPETYRLQLKRNDVGQLLDGLEFRAESWEQTGRYLTNEDSNEDVYFIPEECHKPEEAFGIAEHYRSIIQQIRDQMKAQDS